MMLASSLKRQARALLTHRNSCGLLNHHQMEELKKKLFTDR